MGEKCRLSRTEQRTWSLQTALDVDPEEAWRRLLAGEDLFQNGQDEEDEEPSEWMNAAFSVF